MIKAYLHMFTNSKIEFSQINLALGKSPTSLHWFIISSAQWNLLIVWRQAKQAKMSSIRSQYLEES